MNPYYRICLAVIRLVAACCIIVTVLNFALYYVKSRHNGTPMRAGHTISVSIPLVIGVVILIKSPAWARRLADYLDD
jgi:hypothetical protein